VTFGCHLPGSNRRKTPDYEEIATEQDSQGTKRLDIWQTKCANKMKEWLEKKIENSRENREPGR